MKAKSLKFIFLSFPFCENEEMIFKLIRSFLGFQGGCWMFEMGISTSTNDKTKLEIIIETCSWMLRTFFMNSSTLQRSFAAASLKVLRGFHLHLYPFGKFIHQTLLKRRWIWIWRIFFLNNVEISSIKLVVWISAAYTSLLSILSYSKDEKQDKSLTNLMFLIRLFENDFMKNNKGKTYANWDYFVLWSWQKLWASDLEAVNYRT